MQGLLTPIYGPLPSRKRKSNAEAAAKKLLRSGLAMVPKLDALMLKIASHCQCKDAVCFESFTWHLVQRAQCVLREVAPTLELPTCSLNEASFKLHRVSGTCIDSL